MEVRSPCKGICNLDFATHTVCQGCGRSIDEIRNWNAFTNEHKKTVVGNALERLKEIGYE
jgi:predicted Fe-S protein YdhL (DUF1289 family)